MRRVSTTRMHAVRAPLPTLRDSEPWLDATSVEPKRDRPLLLVLAGEQLGKVVRLDAGDVVLGRGGDATVQITDPGLSWKHARVRVRGDGVYLEDLQSTNGTYVAGERIVSPTRLQDGDRISLGGRTVLKFFNADALEENAAVRMYESAVHDPLTGLFNRRYVEARLASELSYVERHAASLAVFFIDIDHFKHINDRYGHQAGDAVLRVVGATVQRMVRPEDVLARYGGEEFVVIARSISARNASILAERMRRSIEHMELPFAGETASVTISIGIALARLAPPRESASELIDRADAAMYHAKQQGRNRVVAS